MMLPDHEQTCRFCVMDSSEPAVVFDDSGQCNCCRDAIAQRPHVWWPDEIGAKKMADLVTRLKAEGRNSNYDAMIGLSGGIDSAYLAHLMAKEHGLRLLAVHVDGGWNSAPAVRNIETLVRALDIDLHTHVVEWSEMRDLQLAFLEAGVLNQDFPQDHAFFATLFRTAKRMRLKSFLSGVNFSSEGVGTPGAPNPPSVDGRHLRAIHKRFGTNVLRDYPVMTLAEYIWQTRVRKRPVIEKPLNYIAYDKEAAKEVLRQQYGWREYGTKHSESRFTKFYQDIYLPRKHGYDKRKLHFSSLIVSGQMTRLYALTALKEPVISDREASRDLKFIAKKLGISSLRLDEIIDAPIVPHREYPNDMKLHQTLSSAQTYLQKMLGKTSSG
jgi:N-acetyl sugar amidotransferase